MRGRDRDKGTARHRGTSKLGQRARKTGSGMHKGPGLRATENPGGEREGREALEAGRVC